MGAYRLLALDMDGTLLTSDKHILPKTLAAIRSAAERGIAVALSTGRAVNELSEYRPAIAGAIRYASLLSGGQVYDLDANRTIAAKAFDVPMTLTICEQGLRENAMVHVLTTSTTAATPSDIERMPQVGMGVYQGMFRRICTKVDDVPSYLRNHPGEVCKINLYHTDQASRLRTRSRLSQLDAQVTFAEESSLEVTPVGVTKALGLEQLCNHLGISLSECVAVGDAPNDADAFAVAGLAVAMGNATDSMKEQADAVVADNDHDGIAEVIDRFF